MTAIARSYTPDGFVVAADGLALASDTGKMLTEDSQKIFCFGAAPHLSFSFAGSVRLGLSFDLITTVGSVVGALSLDQYNGLRECAQDISYVVHRVLSERQRAGEIRFTQASNEAATG